MSAGARGGRRAVYPRWTAHDPLAGGDGLGPVFNASSCVDCHQPGRTGGGGPTDKNVTVYGLAKPHPSGLAPVGRRPPERDRQRVPGNAQPCSPVVAAPAVVSLSVLTDRSRPRSTEWSITQRNTPALFGDGLIDAISDDDIIAHQRNNRRPHGSCGSIGGAARKIRGRVARLADGRIGRFGWKLEFATLGDFVKAACANELGLSNPGRPQATPLGQPDYKSPGVDLTDDQCGLMADFIRAPSTTHRRAIPLSRSSPRKPGPVDRSSASIGCADCHSESVGPVPGLVFRHAAARHGDRARRGGGVLRPAHSTRRRTESTPEDSQPPSPSEWRTAPLWGVADSGPYLHDGRAASLDQAIELHGGEASGVSGRFKCLSSTEKRSLIAFLKTLKAPAADLARKTLPRGDLNFEGAGHCSGKVAFRSAKGRSFAERKTTQTPVGRRRDPPWTIP